MDSTQVLINSLMSANSVEELRNRLIPLLTRVAEAAPSSGLTNVTSSSLDVTTPSTGVRNIELPYEAIPLSGTTEMEAAEITHTSTGKTATVGFVDGSVYLTATGADGLGAVSASEDTTIIQYDSAVSFYNSLVTLSDGIIELNVNGTVIKCQYDGASQKLAFFGATPVAKAGAIADATDLLSLLTSVNSLLAALRSYGLISL
jgi:hypothetical protein